AQLAARAIVAHYTKTDLSIDLHAEVAHAYAPKSAGPSGETDSTRGDLAAGKAAGAATIEAVYTTQNQHHNPMEMHATTAVWQSDDKVTLYDSTQGVFNDRQKIATVFGLPEENVRIISHFVGGGFGCKGSTWSHVTLAAMAARSLKRPVKVVLTRPQMFGFVGYRPRTEQHVMLAADAHGKLTAIAHHSISETSRIDEFVEPCAMTTRMLYDCPNVETSHRLVRLDVPTPTFTRAPGEASGSFALESAMDELAYALHMDPLELRLRNYAERDPQEKLPWSSKSLKQCYHQAAERFGWSRRSQRPGSMRDGTRLVGWGMATATYPARQSPSSAVARFRSDGIALVQSGSQDIGTGTYTIMTQIAADALDLPLEKVRFELGDTTFPKTPVSGGSQTASSTGSAVKGAAAALRGKLMSSAISDDKSPLHGLHESDLEVVEGVIRAKRDPSKRDSYADVLARSGQPEIRVELDAKPKPDQAKYSRHSFGAQFVEVKVDPDLSEVRVTRCVSAFAAGKILNAKTALSQFQGGIVWGIGLALLEHTVRDPRNARVVTRDLADYHVPVNADVPELDVIMIDEVDPYVNEVGAKGIGEIGITGMAAAIANAVHHATGKRIHDLPITLDKLR
ncbi:MAG TPA: xanthine dehydrogenase family protein molybdopterin-binding subunit, partial [Polyangiales bacterium]|nr:xanthine dehydrogenase family protein molybdopterin-binding subunit [Polyangiales bacterium]